MTRAMFALVCLVFLATFAPVACAPDNALGPTIGIGEPHVGDPCYIGGGRPSVLYIPCRHVCAEEHYECIAERWECISPPIGVCTRLPPSTDAGPEASADVTTDASETTVITDASSDAPRDTSAEASTDAAADVNRDVSTDAATDAGDAGPRPGDTCTNGQGVCTRSGIVSVVNGRLVCTGYDPGLPGMEICNYVDDDCDGLVDEGGVCVCHPGQQYPCYGGSQATQGRGICRVGYHVCNTTGNDLGSCMQQVLPNVRGEICANRLDDDCDGATDEAPCVTLAP